MHTKNLFIHQGRDRKAVKDIGKDFPKLDGEASFAFIVKTINLGDLSTFMISTYDVNSILESNFQTYKKCYNFNTVIATINIIAHEQVVRVRRFPTKEGKESVLLQPIKPTYPMRNSSIKS